MATNRHRGPREILSGGEWIYGRKPVLEVLQSERRKIREMILPPPEKGEADEIAWFRKVAREMGAVVHSEDRKRLDALAHGGNHQGVAAKTDPYPYVPFEEMVEEVEADENALVVVLDHLEDPQNVGSILRSACAAGATGVVIPEDRGAGVTPAVVRASAGASEYLKVARVVNVVRAMKRLQEAGTWFTGLDWGKDARAYTDVDFKGRTGLVVGAEGAGVSRLVRETCDFVAVLPMVGRIESLNAGVAAAICLYEVLRQRGVKGR